MKRLFFLCVFALSASLAISGVASADSGLAVQNTKDVPLAHAPGTPACFAGAPVHGDPRFAPSIMLMKGAASCTVPWHRHPASENIIVTAGTARAQLMGHAWTPLAAGDFISVPAKTAMRFACVSRCSLYVYSDGPFNLQYVNEKGAEITPAAALK